jgi:ParE-like toxin of type II ParDE toxin-antitoxin system
MAIEVNWSDEAIKTFQKNIDYLHEYWSDKEVIRFIQQTENIIIRLKKYPYSYPTGYKNKRYRKARLNKYIAVFYSYNKSNSKIVLLSFWNVKQDPSKLKY